MDVNHNIASTIVRVWTLARSWCPNFVQAEEMRRINTDIDRALRENAYRNNDLIRYSSALKCIAEGADPAAAKIAKEALRG